MLEIQEKENIEIVNMIYEIRGQQVMLDSDLAKLYQCKNGTKEINQAVKNNIEKFPERFSFRIEKNEIYDFLVKNFDQKKKKHVVEDTKILEFLLNKVLQCLLPY